MDANQFAAALLMPAEFLQDADCDVEDEREIEQWVKEFGVSKAALQYRLRNLSGVSRH